MTHAWTVDAIVADTIAITRIPAPSFDESRRVEWLEHRLAAAPGRLERDAAGSLLWSWGDGPPRLVATAHIDTVFPLETPLDPTVRHGYLVGPGVGDNGVGDAITVAVVEDLLRRDLLAPGVVAFTTGEEGLGNLHGAKQVVRDLRPPALLAIEGQGQEVIALDTLGSLRAKVTVRGPGGHSWEDRGALSAIAALFEAGQRILALAAPDTPVNVGTVIGGRSVNTIADHAEILVEMRAVEMAPLEAFRGALEALSVAPPLTIAVEVVGLRPAGRLSRESLLARAVLEVRAELELAGHEEAWSTDANAAIAEGIPAVAIGLCRGGGMHTLDERVAMASIETGALFLEGVLLRLLAKE